MIERLNRTRGRDTPSQTSRLHQRHDREAILKGEDVDVALLKAGEVSHWVLGNFLVLLD